MDLWQIILIAAGVIILALLLALMVVYFKLTKKNKTSKVEGVKVIDNVRYTKDDKIIKDNGAVKVSHVEGDFLLERGVVYKASKTGKLLPGKYVALCANENAVVFNLRLNGFVREFEHNTPIVVTDGEEICATSHNVILR